MKYKDFLKLDEAKIKKIVNRKGQIRKIYTAGQKGKKVDSSGKIVAQTAVEKRNKRLGVIQKKKTMKRISASKKKRSAKFAAAGRNRREKSNITDYRSK